MQLATLCYLRKNNKTLMLHRVKKENDMHEGKWNGLGGKFLPGETPEECALREIKEESGYEIGRLKLHGFIVFPLFDGLQDWNVFIFSGEQLSGEEIVSEEGDLRWIENDKLLDLELWEGDKIFLKWLDKDSIFSAKFVYDCGKLISFDVVFY